MRSVKCVSLKYFYFIYFFDCALGTKILFATHCKFIFAFLALTWPCQWPRAQSLVAMFRIFIENFWFHVSSSKLKLHANYTHILYMCTHVLKLILLRCFCLLKKFQFCITSAASCKAAACIRKDYFVSITKNSLTKRLQFTTIYRYLQQKSHTVSRKIAKRNAWELKSRRCRKFPKNKRKRTKSNNKMREIH